MKNQLSLATLFLRLALAASFLSAVASRLGFLGSASSGWRNFLAYTAEVNSFVPIQLIPVLAIAATVLETTFACLLIVGYNIRWVALGASLLTLVFALTMTYSFGVKAPLDYSVFAFSAGSFLLSNIEGDKLSLDGYLRTKHTA